MKLRYSQMAGPLSKGPKTPGRPKACTQSTWAFKLLVFSLALVLFRPFFVHAEGENGNPFKILASKIEETAKPLIQAASPAEENDGGKAGEKRKKKRKKTYVQKANEDREDFHQKEQERKAKFLKKLRGQDMTDEERQKKISKFYAKELERKRKFAEKMKQQALKNARKEG